MAIRAPDGAKNENKIMDACRIMNNKAKFGGYLIVGVDGLNFKDFEEEASMLLERARMLTSVDAAV